MSEPPLDPPLPRDSRRLRAILAHLDKQLADNAAVAVHLDEQLADIRTVGTYLRLQRDAVQAALGQAEAPPGPLIRPSRPVKGAKGLPALAQAQVPVGFVVQQKPTPMGPEPTLIHMADCTMIEGTPHRIRPDEARADLTDPTITACNFCRPDTECRRRVRQRYPRSTCPDEDPDVPSDA
ncbi:DUF6233 domain-containing protein [Streptomyces alanosinicus]|uniref:Uncharacterized protein n=1 Tax=Streptomyces alanosinicus TaxID=68171 RepID=A0A918YSA4_9ACTN|nr:DUF6233 domain-containing protein [Streptomyces alanosinicus]GHE14280.1 hypothetical protein GCM10010339_84320 [Streptomyces alanosinicus]